MDVWFCCYAGTTAGRPKAHCGQFADDFTRITLSKRGPGTSVSLLTITYHGCPESFSTGSGACVPLRSLSDEVVQDVAGDVCQAEVTAAVAVGELLVVDA